MLRSVARMAAAGSSPPADYVGASGITYHFQHLLQQRPHLGRVWTAHAQTGKFLLKDLPESYYENYNEDIRPRLREHPNLRLPVDHIPQARILVYQFLSHDFLDLVRSKIPYKARKSILRDVLQGLKELHGKRIVHLDIKPDNVLIDCHGEGECLAIEKVEIADFENSVWLQPGKNVEGLLAGNDNWRSPEAHLRSKLNTPTDMFSFGVMCVYAMTGKIIFGRDEDFDYQESQGNLAQIIRLQRQISYFGECKGFQGLLRHLGEHHDMNEVLCAMWEDRNDPAIPYKHFSTWPEITDDSFKDLVLGLTRLDPGARLTACEALQHPWRVASYSTRDPAVSISTNDIYGAARKEPINSTYEVHAERRDAYKAHMPVGQRSMSSPLQSLTKTSIEHIHDADMWKSSKIFTRTVTSKGKEIAVGYVSKTDVWERVFLAESVTKDFAAVVEKYKDTFKQDTVQVVMKEPEHASPSDHQTHFSALELDSDEKVIASRHLKK